MCLKLFEFKSTPSGSLHAGDGTKQDPKRPTGNKDGRRDDNLKPANNPAKNFGSTQVCIIIIRIVFLPGTRDSTITRGKVVLPCDGDARRQFYTNLLLFYTNQ
jgi:hypothetical protein